MKRFWLHQAVRICLVLLLLSASCKLFEKNEDSDEEEPAPRGPITFTSPPVDYSRINRATPLGNLNPAGGHVFPTNHIYFYLNGSTLAEVRAVGPGKIISRYYNSWSNDYRLEIEHTSTFRSYMDHVGSLPAAIVEGVQVRAGDLLGYGNPSVSAIDLGVVDEDITRTFIVPQRYHEFSLHCGDPYSYFTATVRDRLLAYNNRTVDPRGGKIDFDVSGRLSGNWFMTGVPLDSNASGFDYRASQLAFVFDMIDPSVIRISCGGTLALAPFDFRVEGNSPDPRSVSVASGMVKYRLVRATPATLTVQLTNASTIRAEVFSGKTPDQVSAFTSQAKTYTR